MPGRVSKLLFFNLFKPFPHLTETMSSNPSTMPLLHHLSTIPNRPMRGERRDDASEDVFLRKFESGYEDSDEVDERRSKAYQNPPNPIPDRPLRGEKRRDQFKLGNHEDDENLKQSHQIHQTQFRDRPMRGGKREDRCDDDLFTNKFDLGGSTHNEEKMKQSYQNPPVQFSNRSMRGEKRDDQSVDSFLEKFKLGDEKKENPRQNTPTQIPVTETGTSSDSPHDADEIFKKMKETGLIPNAVAMLDGLCKDGLVQEAMKLFGLMREKGTIPEVVIYTAVVEGFCKARKLDDAKRIFRKMQNNGISPNAFSYTVLIQGLCKEMRLEDAVDFCVEMLEAGHSPNVVIFAGLIDSFCREKGVEEAESVIGRLREKGFFVDEKAVREHLDKKGPFSPLVWEAIFGKKSSQKPF